MNDTGGHDMRNKLWQYNVEKTGHEKRAAKV